MARSSTSSFHFGENLFQMRRMRIHRLWCMRLPMPRRFRTFATCLAARNFNSLLARATRRERTSQYNVHTRPCPHRSLSSLRFRMLASWSLDLAATVVPCLLHSAMGGCASSTRLPCMALGRTRTKLDRLRAPSAAQFDSTCIPSPRSSSNVYSLRVRYGGRVRIRALRKPLVQLL